MSYYVQTICCVMQQGGGADTCCWVDGGGTVGTRGTADAWFAVDNAGHWLQEQVQVHGRAEEGCWVPKVTCCVGSCWTVAVVGSCPDICGGGDEVSVIATDVAELMKDV